MKWKIFGIVIFILMLVVVAFGVFFWTYKKEIAERYLAKTLQVPVTISQFGYSDGKLFISNLWIGNPNGFHSKTAFSCNRLTLSNLQVNRGILFIDTIEMDGLFVDIESRSQNGTNWDIILSHKIENKKKYLVPNLILRNLTVTTIDASGEAKEFPLLSGIELHNLSDTTGLSLERALLTLIYAEALKVISEEKTSLPTS